MKNELIKRNILITMLTSIIFLIMSFFIMSYSNKKTKEKELTYVSNFFNESIANKTIDEMIVEANRLTSEEDYINIVFASISDGLMLYDSENDSIGNDIVSYIDSIELEKISNTLDSDRIYTVKNEIYYISIVNGYIVRLNVRLEFETNYILLSIFFMLILLVFEVFVTYKTSTFTTRKVLKTLGDIESNLKDINNNQIDKPITTEYEEVEPIIKEINKVYKNVNNSFKILEKERNKLLLVINKINEGIIIIDNNKNILIVNDSVSTNINKNKDEILNRRIDEFIKDQSFNKTIDDVILNKNNESLDLKSENNRFIYLVNINYLNVSWDNIKDIIIITFSDVTIDRKSSKIKSDFISNASHELKTPVTSIKGFSELLSLDIDKYDTETKKYIERINKESTRIVSLVDELIYLSNLEYFDESKICDKIYIKDIVSDIIDSLSNNSLNVTLIDEVDDSYVITEEQLFYRLIKNLIENAIKYNKENGKVFIKSYKEDDKIILTIRDTGIGIEEKNLDRIFERFYRVDKSRSSSISGTGLGLNIVKESVDKMNATIKVESKINEGTKFTIEFKNSTNE